MKNKLLVGIIPMMLLLVVGTVVLAQGPPSSSNFSLTQTYPLGAAFYWGPSEYYGETVTIVYEGDNRSVWNPKNHRFNLRIVGTATVYSGDTVSGDPIDVRPFENTETWTEPGNTWGWPVSWYTCGVKQLHYKWIIPGVYDFTVTAKDGYWTIETTAYTNPPTRGGWYPNTPPLEFNACP